MFGGNLISVEYFLANLSAIEQCIDNLLEAISLLKKKNSLFVLLGGWHKLEVANCGWVRTDYG